MFSFDFGDRIPEGFIPDESLSIAGKAIEEVAQHRWLNAEELLLLLMLPHSLQIDYINTLPSPDAPYQVGRIYLLAGDSKQSMFDGIEYEKRQTEDRSNTQSGIYSQLSINKRQVIEGVYSTTSSTLRRRYYYMRDENERIRKVIHYRHITESELQEATNRREGKKKPLEEGAAGTVVAKRERGRKVTKDAVDLEEEVDSPKHLRSGAKSGPNPNKTIPIHFSVLYNCYKYLFYKDLERLTPKGTTNKTFPSHRSTAKPNPAMHASPMQYTYVKSEDDGHQRQSLFSAPPVNLSDDRNIPLSCQPIQLISPRVFTHHRLKYTQHCTIVLASPSMWNLPNAPVEVFYDKIQQDPSLMIPGANIPLEEARIRGLGKQLTANVFECCLTPALSAGQWKLTIFDQNHQLIAYTDHTDSMLTIVEESRAERFESMKRRRQKSNSMDVKRLEEVPQHPYPPSNNYYPPNNAPIMQVPQANFTSSVASVPGRMDSDHSSGMMHEAISLLLRRGSSQERENDQLMMLDENDRYNRQPFQPSDRSRTMSEGIAISAQPQQPLAEPQPDGQGWTDYSRNSNMQAYFADRSSLNSDIFATATADYYRTFLPNYHDMQQYSFSETDSYAVSSATLSDAEYSVNESGSGVDGEGEVEGSQSRQNNDEIIRILSHQMSLGDGDDDFDNDLIT